MRDKKVELDGYVGSLNDIPLFVAPIAHRVVLSHFTGSIGYSEIHGGSRMVYSSRYLLSRYKEKTC